MLWLLNQCINSNFNTNVQVAYDLEGAGHLWRGNKVTINQSNQYLFKGIVRTNSPVAVTGDPSTPVQAPISLYNWFKKSLQKDCYV
jgi:hypothetical protein